MTVLHYDAEVFSECDLKEAGVYRYAEHPSTELLMLTYRFDKGVPRLWIPYDDVPDALLAALKQQLGDKAIVNPGTTVPREVIEHIESGGQTRAQNHQYERVVLNAVAGRKLHFPHVKIEQTVCTMAKAMAAGMPAGLGDCATALGTHSKDDAGRSSMLQITKPRKPTKDDPSTRWTMHNAPEKWLDVLVYNVDDVLSECGVDAALPELTAYEQQVYYFDQRMNERGIAVDREGIEFVIEIREEYKNFLAVSMEKATRPIFAGNVGCPTCNGTRRVEKLLRKKPTGVFLECLDCRGLEPTQRDKIAEWIRANGWPNLLDMQADTVKKLVARDDVPDNVKHVLRIYSTYNAKAVSKFDAMLAAVCADGRLRGMFMYHGAGTGRWSSKIVQLQNLFRPVIDDPETAVTAFRSRNLDWIKALWPQDPMKVMASTVRQHLVAAPGKKLICLDYSGVESRYNAWVWNEEWKIEAFRKFDAGEGPDLYRIAYANLFRMDPRDVNKAQRQEGKPIDLFGQYEGGVGAFVNLAGQYGTNLFELTEKLWPHIPEDVLDSAVWMWNKFGKHSSELPERVYLACDSAKQIWRRAHPATVGGWKELKNAAELAVQFEGKAYPIAGGKGFFKVVTGPRGHKWLAMLLPSRQRMLRYYKPEWTPPKTVVTLEPVFDHDLGMTVNREVERVLPGELHYHGVDTDTRRWMRTSAYGGAWNNNWVQGGCADLIRSGMFEMESGGYPIVLTVHDEGGAEVDESFGSVDHAMGLFCTPKPWFEGLPLVAEGWEGRRYRK